MTVALYQESLFGALATGTAPTLRPARVSLAHSAWIDYQPGWVAAADDLFETLSRAVPWHAERRVMYDNVVDVPRLTKFYAESEPLPHPRVAELRESLSAHYAPELGEPFATAGFCLYRDGRDSVAWHGDRIGKSRSEDTMVAIVSLGSTRDLALRPAGGGPSQRFRLDHGDLVVMGGSCQRTWEHAIPKVSSTVGPRMSIQFRVAGVR